MRASAFGQEKSAGKQILLTWRHGRRGSNSLLAKDWAKSEGSCDQAKNLLKTSVQHGMNEKRYAYLEERFLRWKSVRSLNLNVERTWLPVRRQIRANPLQLIVVMVLEVV